MHVVSSGDAVSFLPVAVKWGEKKIRFGYVFPVLFFFRCALSPVPSNLTHILFQALHITNTSSLDQHNVANLFAYKLLSSILKRTAGVFIFENDIAELSYFCPWYCHDDFNLSLV